VRVAYVMMVHSMHRAAAWRRVPCAAQFCAATRCVVVVSRECRGAKIDYFPSILILPKPWKKLLHNVMQYSAEGRKTTILAQNQGTKITSWRNKFNLTNRNVTIIMLTCAAIHTERGSVKYNNCAKSDIK